MSGLRDYLISVTAAAIITGITTGVTKKSGSISSVVKLLSGLFVAVTILHPVIDFSFSDLQLCLDQMSLDAEGAAESGMTAANEEIRQIIKDRSCAFIQEKANSLGANLEIEVNLEGTIPRSVRIIGAVSPYAKLQLSQYITTELGILLEDQQWIG